MIKEFIQKRKFNYRKHTLYTDKVVVEYKTAKQIVKYEVKIDQIGSEIYYEKENSMSKKLLCLFFLIAPIIANTLNFFLYNKLDLNGSIMIFVISYFLVFLIYLNESQDDLFLLGQKNLVFYRDIPSEKEVLEFISLVIIASNDFFKTKYTRIDSHITEEEFIDRLNWLLEKNIITDKEWSDLREDFKIERLLK